MSQSMIGLAARSVTEVLLTCSMTTTGTDHDSEVLARRTFRCRAWDLGVALDWAAERAAAMSWAGVAVSCEPTGHRWRVLGQLAADRSMPFVCVQPMQTSWARRS